MEQSVFLERVSHLPLQNPALLEHARERAKTR